MINDQIKGMSLENRAVKRYMAKSNLYFILRASLFALVVNLPYINEFVSTHGNSPNVFNDSDETVYLRQAYYIADNLPMQAIYKEHARYTSLAELILMSRPDHAFSHLVVGSLANILSLQILELNLVLDLVCSFVAYIMFAIFIRSVISGFSAIRSEIVAFFFLASPWVFSLENYITLHSIFPSIATTFPFMSHSSLPIQEGIEGQLSVLWMILCLYAWNRSRSGSMPALIISGITHGLLIYVYVLAWLGLGALLGLLMFLENILPFEKKAESLYNIIWRIFVFSCSSLIISSPGLYLVLNKSLKEPLYSSYGSIYSNVWYLPVELLAVMALSLVYLLYRRTHAVKHSYSLTLMFISSLLAEFILLNIQPIVGFTMCGLYILVFFLRPLVTAIVVTFILSRFSENQTIRNVMFLFYFLLIGASFINGKINFAKNAQFTKDSTQLVEYLKSERIEKSVVAMLTHEKAFSENASEFDIRWEPNAIAAITGNYLLQEALFTPSYLLKSNEIIEREMFLGLLFAGRPQLIKACGNDINTEPRYNFFLQWIAVQAARVELCRQTSEYRQNMPACELITKYEVDYIILETKLQAELPLLTRSFSSFVWRSVNNEYAIYKIDRNQALGIFCQ